MAYVPGFEHDVFISYAHADNDPLVGKEGYISIFTQILEKRLRAKLSNPTVWRDRQKLVGNASLTDQLLQALRQSATLLVIVSPAYLRSEWCGKERENFVRIIRERTNSGSRIFLVEIDEVNRTEFPKAFSDLISYRLWVEDNETKKPILLGSPVPTEDDREYFQRIEEICIDLAKELERQAVVAKSVAPSPLHSSSTLPAASDDCIYLAEVTDDLDSVREEVKGYLKQAGFRVIPETWQTFSDQESFNQTIDGELADCAVFVQLLSGVVGRRPFNQSFGLPRLRYERAVRMKKPILQWRDPRLFIDDDARDDHHALLTNITVRAEGIEAFKRAIVEAARPIPTSTPSLADGIGKFVFVSTDITDRPRAEAVINDCTQNTSVGYIMPPIESDPKELRQFMEVGLSDCDAALIVYCGAGQASVLSQIMQCRKILGQRQPPIPPIAIYDGPPPPADKPPLSLRLPNIIHLDCRQDSAKLKEFFSRI